MRRIAGWALVGLAAASADPAPAPAVPLDRLFKLPASSVGGALEERHGGKTRAEWEERFRSATADLAAAREALADSRKKLEEIAPDKGWSMSAPGMPVSANEAPLDFKLRQEMRRQREDVEHAERHLEELTVEANLAGVPEDWRPAPPKDEPGAASAPESAGAPPAAAPPSAAPSAEAPLEKRAD